MTLPHSLRKSARKLGIEVHRYDEAHLLEVRLLALIKHHAVDLVVNVDANAGGYGGAIRPVQLWTPSVRPKLDGRWH